MGVAGCFVWQRKLGCASWLEREEIVIKTLEFKFYFFGCIFSHPACANIVKPRNIQKRQMSSEHRVRTKLYLFFEVPLFFSLSVTLYQSLPDNSWPSIKSMGNDIRVLTTHLLILPSILLCQTIPSNIRHQTSPK